MGPSTRGITLSEHGGLAFFGPAEVARLGWVSAVDALERALLAGFDPESDPPRSRLSTAGGELLLMPSQLDAWAGTKLVTVSPANPRSDRPLVQGVYVLFEAATGTPVAVLDGAALTALRTAAVSALAVRHLAQQAAARLLVFGAGVQAVHHIDALLATQPITHVQVVGRRPERAGRVVAALTERGVAAATAESGAVAEADIVVCATDAGVPLFSGAAVRPGTVVVAIGSHTPDTREVDTALVVRSHVIVESRRSALAEAGDVLIPIGEGTLAEDELLSLSDIVRTTLPRDDGRPRLFTGTGMAWQDLVTAAAVVEQNTASRH